MSERKASPVERQMFEDLRWAETAKEVQQHIGKLVVIYRKRVIAVGSDQDALLSQAAAKEHCAEEDLVIVAVPRPELVQKVPTHELTGPS